MNRRVLIGGLAAVLNLAALIGSGSLGLELPVGAVGTTPTLTKLNAGTGLGSPGAPQTFTATVKSASSNEPLTSGTVAFTADRAPIDGCSAVNLDATGTATCTTTFSVAGSPGIQASYSGDDTYAPSASVTFGIFIGNAPRIVVESSAPTVPANVAVALFIAATAPDAGSSSAVTGGISVTEVTGPNPADRRPVNGCDGLPLVNGKVVCVTSFSTEGAQELSIQYSPPTNSGAGYRPTFASFTQSVGVDSTRTRVVGGGQSIGESGVPAVPGSSVPLSARFTTLRTASTPPVPVPEGRATFVVNGRTLDGCENVPLTSDGLAKCTTTALPTGLSYPSVVYLGSANYQGAVVQMGLAGVGYLATVEVTASANPAPVGNPVTLTISVAGSAGVPRGSVSIERRVGTGPSATIAPVSGCTDLPVVNGTARCVVSDVPVGSYELQARFTPASVPDQQYLGGQLEFEQVIAADVVADPADDPANPPGSDLIEPIALTRSAAEAAADTPGGATAQATGATLAATGADATSSAILGFVLVGVGLVLIGATRLRRRPRFA